MMIYTLVCQKNFMICKGRRRNIRTMHILTANIQQPKVFIQNRKGNIMLLLEATVSADENTAIVMFATAFFIAFILILIIGFRAIRISSKIKKQQKQLRKERMQQLKNSGMTIQFKLFHVNGLPITENMPCEISSYPDRIEFESGTTKISLARQKITDMCIKTDTEIQQQAVSSVGGAIAGGVMFGPLGAIIGGRAKNKKVKTVTKYLIITYLNDTKEMKYIGFDIQNNIMPACKLVEEFQRLNTNIGVQIEL